MTRAPLIIDLDDEAPRPGDAPLTPETAPPVPDPDGTPEGAGPQGRAMQAAAALAASPPSRAGRVLRWALGGLLALGLSVAAWDFVTGLLARAPWLGWAASALLVLGVGAALVLAAREVAAFRRLARIGALRRGADAALAAADLTAARAVTARLSALYAERAEMRAARASLAERAEDRFDAATEIEAAERALLAPLDAEARIAVEGAARQVATVTAFVPLALADVAAALLGNLRMIRRVAEIYGGRAGTLGSWRLTRAVLTHLVTTGAVAVGDDMVSSMAGGGLVSKLSRRFGEGVVNGALTARVGVAAIEVCRPLPFRALPRPRVTALVSRALTGLFSG